MEYREDSEAAANIHTPALNFLLLSAPTPKTPDLQLSGRLLKFTQNNQTQTVTPSSTSTLKISATLITAIITDLKEGYNSSLLVINSIRQPGVIPTYINEALMGVLDGVGRNEKVEIEVYEVYAECKYEIYHGSSNSLPIPPEIHAKFPKSHAVYRMRFAGVWFSLLDVCVDYYSVDYTRVVIVEGELNAKNICAPFDLVKNPARLSSGGSSDTFILRDCKDEFGGNCKVHILGVIDPNIPNSAANRIGYSMILRICESFMSLKCFPLKSSKTLEMLLIHYESLAFKPKKNVSKNENDFNVQLQNIAIDRNNIQIENERKVQEIRVLIKDNMGLKIENSRLCDEIDMTSSIQQDNDNLRLRLKSFKERVEKLNMEIETLNLENVKKLEKIEGLNADVGRCERASVRSATKSKEMAFDLMSLVNKTAALEKKCSVMEGHSARLLSHNTFLQVRYESKCREVLATIKNIEDLKHTGGRKDIRVEERIPHTASNIYMKVKDRIPVYTEPDKKDERQIEIIDPVMVVEEKNIFTESDAFKELVIKVNLLHATTSEDMKKLRLKIQKGSDDYTYESVTVPERQLKDQIKVYQDLLMYKGVDIASIIPSIERKGGVDVEMMKQEMYAFVKSSQMESERERSELIAKVVALQAELS